MNHLPLTIFKHPEHVKRHFFFLTCLSNIIKLSMVVNGEMFPAAAAACVSRRALTRMAVGDKTGNKKAICPSIHLSLQPACAGLCFGQAAFPHPITKAM